MTPVHALMTLIAPTSAGAPCHDPCHDYDHDHLSAITERYRAVERDVGDAGVARDEMAETLYQRAIQGLWEGADSSAGYCGGGAGHVAGHRGGGGIVDRPGHLRAELMGGIHVHQLLLRRGTLPGAAA